MSAALQEAKEVLAIVIISILASVLYGIAHDQITARVSLEYFTVAHPDIFGTHSPTHLGLIWGVIATWWVGLFLGLLLSLAARFGSAPKVCPRSLVPQIFRLMLVCGCAALLCGLVCYSLALRGTISVPIRFAPFIPPENHARFMAAAGAHNTSYFVGFIGGAVIAVRVALERSRAVFYSRQKECDVSTQ